MWAKLDDQFFLDTKARAVGKDGRALYIAGLCYCAAQLTDGKIPKLSLALVAAMAEADPAVAGDLVDVGMWVDGGDCFIVNKYLEYNPSSDVVRERRRQRSESGRLGGQRSGESRRSKSEANGEASGSANGEANVKPNRTPSPSPSPSLPSSSRKRSDSREPWDAEFTAWWDKYPRKVSKQAALKAFTARRREGVALDDLTRARDIYASSRVGEDSKFTLHAATFLGRDGPWVEWLAGNPDGVRADPDEWADRLARGET